LNLFLNNFLTFFFHFHFRCLSSLKDERICASQVLSGPENAAFAGDKKAFIEQVRKWVR
jgi:6-phosphogluconate dehydrogenase